MEIEDRPHLLYTSKAILTLVEDCWILRNKVKASECMFITVSPNPKTVHFADRPYGGIGKKLSVKIPYGRMRQEDQYDYCLKIIEKCYLEFCSPSVVLIGTVEHNKTGNVHAHFLLYDPKITNKSKLDIFRRDISYCDMVIKNMSKSSKQDHMNNIVFINDSITDRATYMDKDYEMNQDIYFNYCYFGPSSGCKLI